MAAVVVPDSFCKKYKKTVNTLQTLQTKNFECRPVNSTMHTATKIFTLTYTDNHHTNAGGKRESHMKNQSIYTLKNKSASRCHRGTFLSK